MLKLLFTRRLGPVNLFDLSSVLAGCWIAGYDHSWVWYIILGLVIGTASYIGERALAHEEANK